MVSDSWIRVYVAHTALEGHVVVSALQHAGINAELRPSDGTGFGAALPTLETPAVWVRVSDADDARAVIQNAAETETGRLSLTDDRSGTLGLEEDDGDPG